MSDQPLPPPTNANMRVNFFHTAQGELGMLLVLPLTDGGTTSFAIFGEQLETFYLRLREQVEGHDKPGYVQ